MARRILIAVGVLAALVTALALMRRGTDREIRRARSDARLVAFDERAVTAFVLSIRGGRDWRFERAGDGWRLVAPVRDVGGREMIGGMLAALRHSPVERTIEAPDALESYGLDPPVASLRLEGVDVPRIDLGDMDPTRAGLFVRVDGRGGVLVVRLPDARLLREPNPNAFRDPSTTGVVRSEVEGIEIGGPEGSLALAKRPDGWWIEHPIRIPAADGQVDRLLGALESALLRVIDDTTPPSDPKTGLGSRSRTVRLVTATATRTLTLGAVDADGRRFLLRDDRPALLMVEAAPLEGAPFDAGALAERRLTKISRYAVASFRYEKGGERFEASRQGKDAWTTSGGAALEAERVFAFLVRLLEAPVSDFRQGAANGRPLALLEVTLDGGATDRLVFLDGGSAAVDSIPGIVFRVSGTPPDPPRP